MAKTRKEPVAEQIEPVVIVASQAGLTISYHLTQKRRCHVVLEQAEHISPAWRGRPMGFLHSCDPQLVGPVARISISGRRARWLYDPRGDSGPSGALRGTLWGPMRCGVLQSVGTPIAV